MEIKIKMDKTAIIVSSVVGSLGLLAAILGFSAEGANSTNPSPGLGICAGIFLLAAQVTVSAVSGCGCCKSRAIPSETKRVVGIVCAVGSWIAAVIAFVLFVDGAAVNASGYYVKGGIYAGAGVLALAATALGITSFVMLRSQPADAAPGPDVPNKTAVQQPVHGIPVMVHPQPHYTQYPPAESAQPDNHRQDQLPPTPPPQMNNPHSPPPAPPQGNGSPAPIQQFSPQGCPADTAPPAATNAPNKPAEQPQTPTAGVPMGQPQFPPAQAYVQPQVLNGTLQVPQVGVDIPVAPPVLPADSPLGNGLSLAPPAAPSQGNGLSTVIRNEIARATIRLAGKAAEHALFGDYTVTDPTGAGVGATDCGDSAV
ncbi:hypothetical protein SETIT_3G229900v2 [Setaria italica]|uniref:Uncharacterized protein n=1 Tax=Setaria italica TaxID=4555 RepID=A0A368QIC5_SETIT|nr:proline-rich receptor-like protein kinase PERK8 [Setaria italica]RCV17564.1 hypothetical protein SETIT_3G229900v2 [Setaria italica]